MLKNKEQLIPIGLLSLVIAILLGRYVEPTPIISFAEGMFYGLSIVFNLYALILTKKKS